MDEILGSHILSMITEKHSKTSNFFSKFFQIKKHKFALMLDIVRDRVKEQNFGITYILSMITAKMYFRNLKI